MVRRLGTVVLTLVACAVSAGCIGKSSLWAYPHSRMETVAETPEEHVDRVSGVFDRDRRALADDLDLLFQTDRPTRLSKWHGR